MSGLIPNGKQRFFDANGNPLAGGSVAFYQPGTLTPVDTYANQALTTVNPNPITLDASGEMIAWGADSTSYRQQVFDSLGNLIWDQVTAIAGFANPMTAAGDLVVGATGGAGATLHVGANG